MRGVKRAAVSESNESPFKNAKPVEGILFGNQKNLALIQQSLLTPASLDKQRAELARKHVRALNNQFVSWVQLQLKNHPDELWEDGMNDYIAHASNILEKFKDVVNWLKENKGKGENVSPESRGAEKKLVAEVKNSDVKSVSNNSLFGSNSQPGHFSNNQSSNFSSSQSGFFSSQPGAFSSSPGLTSNSQTGSFSSGQFGTKSSQPGAFSSNPSGLTSNSQTGSFSSGQFGFKSSQPILSSGSQAGAISNSQPSYQFSNNQPPFTSGVTPVSIQAKRDSTDDADGEDEQPQPSSPSVKKAEEKGVTVVHEVKCKLYVKSNDPTDKGWKDKGTGNLYIKCKEGVDKGTKESKPTILVRNDVGKLLLNALLYTGINTSTQKNALVAIFHSSEDSNENVTPRTFLIRTKTAEARDKLATAIQEYAPSS
ncbi:Ran binding domain [Arabidopsis thaliana x Arabidopsis arenosa]|uniref:Ran binding domain n=1 Tax=Arabidopsis thaliana x Arabidopsis arenosa TaxID=1240361 RepID=A0A8T1Z4L5_9BRAS|nr:Ran binding domain [Arabidopsis thaliana x Arabidopsis arenosa]